jgi:hypothetical protein
MIDSRLLPAPRQSSFIRALEDTAAGDLLAEEVTFSSPFADYRGRADVVHLFGLIARVLQAPSVTAAATDGTLTYTSLTGSVDGRVLQAVVCERHDDEGRLAHATLFLRPYHVLRAAMDAMGQLLADAPLPSAR